MTVQNDPELRPMFEEMKTGGMGAMMKYWNDPKVLAKIGEKMGQVPGQAAGGQSPAAPSAAAPPDVSSLLDAARYTQLAVVA